jgi:hypothetical protein
MSPRRAWPALAALAIIAAMPASAQERARMTDNPQASRPAPPRVSPVEHKGIRYEQDLESSRYGGGGLGGYLVARDPKTGERLWMLQVYDVKDQTPSGVDAIGLYFRSMKLVRGKDELEIEDEAGRRFRVDVVARTVAQVSAPSERKTSPPPAGPKPRPPG